MAFAQEWYENLPEEEKAEADELYRRRLVYHYYRIFNGGLNKPHLHALRDPLLLPRQHLVDRAGRQWNGNLTTLKGALLRMVEYWHLLPGTEGSLALCNLPVLNWTNLLKRRNYGFKRMPPSICGGINSVVSVKMLGSAMRSMRTLSGRLTSSNSLLSPLARGDQEDIDLLEKGWPFRDREGIN